jgi:hypothetical protein
MDAWMVGCRHIDSWETQVVLGRMHIDSLGITGGAWS